MFAIVRAIGIRDVQREMFKFSVLVMRYFEYNLVHVVGISPLLPREVRTLFQVKVRKLRDASKMRWHFDVTISMSTVSGYLVDGWLARPRLAQLESYRDYYGHKDVKS
jgi:hypothetical protein